ETELRGEVQHSVIVGEDASVERAVAGVAGARAQALEQGAPDALALPCVGDREGEFRRRAVRAGRVAADGDEAALVQHHEGELALVVELGEASEQLRRQLAQVLHEALVARARGEPTEERELELDVLGPDRSHCQARAVPQPEIAFELGGVAECRGQTPILIRRPGYAARRPRAAATACAYGRRPRAPSGRWRGRGAAGSTARRRP